VRLAEIRHRIQTAAVYPPIARARNEVGETRIAFEIGPEGRAMKIRVARSSGSATLDRAAARAVESAEPLPRLVGEINVPVRFELSDPD
jgi:TonB family protein